MSSDELSYASPRDPLWKRLTIRAIENLSGRTRIIPLYRQWNATAKDGQPPSMAEALRLVGTALDISAPHWPPRIAPETPLVMIANHPFGIGDGLALLALAEQIGRPYRILINADFLRIPALRPVALPVDFSATRQAIETNLKSRNEARRVLKAGMTLAVFPAGGVATADRPFGKAEELPWKTFTARLIQDAEATVLPVYFDGQNSALFHFVSRYSLTMRLALLVSEFRRVVGRTVKAHIGEPVPFAALGARHDRALLTEELYLRVQRLAPGADALPAESLRPTPPAQRRRYPWDEPPRGGKASLRAATGETTHAA